MDKVVPDETRQFHGLDQTLDRERTPSITAADLEAYTARESVLSRSGTVLDGKRARSSTENGRGVTCLERADDVLNQSISWSVFVCVLTLWALFIDDLKVLFLPKSVDAAVFITNLAVLLVFICEFVVCWAATPGYACTLGALMDFFAAASLLPFEEILAEIGGFGDKFSVARVARAARALRILRSMRAAAMALRTEARIRQVRRILDKSEDSSVLADTLLKSTNTKMLLGILALLMGTTLLDYTEPNRAAETGLVQLDAVYGYLQAPYFVDPGGELESWEHMWHNYRSAVEGAQGKTLCDLMVLQVWGTTYVLHPTEALRKTDIHMHFAGNAAMRARSVAVVSCERMSKQHAVNSILITMFSVFVIITWAWSFRRDHRRLVIAPCTRMITSLREMALDPRKVVERTCSRGLDEQATEMQVIEYCFGRFGGLLKVGFGEAGLGIISRNLAQEQFDPVVPGHIVQAVFGFCDIRNFTDCCEVLKKDTMIFTNGIAHIVHNVVQESGGSVNKNIGDAFLSVWKLKETVEEEHDSAPNGGQEHLKPARSTKRTYTHHLNGATNTCDLTLKAFLSMNELMKSSPSIQKLSSDPRLQRKLPGYAVRLGSGLHLGWAIEGAVGSSHKVDATYLSPHVNMASRLEAATKQYGVKILMSDALVDAFSPELHSECRPVDRVTVKGSEVPLVLYVHMPSESEELSDIQRSHFMLLWTEAFGLYQTGENWGHAATLMKQCLEVLPRDEPAKVLLEVMEEAGGKAPHDWPGYRALTSK